MQAKTEAVSLCFTSKINILIYCFFSLDHWAKHCEEDIKKKTYNMLFNQKHMKQKKKSGDTPGGLTCISIIVPQVTLFIKCTAVQMSRSH